MTHVSEVLDLSLIERHIVDGNVSARKHPEWDLTILNYTAQAQYARAWDPVTLSCRGLILDGSWNVVGCGWRKFFNASEYDGPLPSSVSPSVTEKADGSLGLIYPSPDGRFRVATRGSFASAQALWATAWLDDHMPNFTQPEGVTTLVEIIYPSNRIVVDYGDTAELVLLGAVNVTNWADVPLDRIDWWSGSRTREHDLSSLDEALSHVESSPGGTESEGVVLAWHSEGGPSFRLKVKHPRYVELHRVVTGLNRRRVWEVLAAGGGFSELIDVVPDEFYGWVSGVAADLQAQYRRLEDEVYEEFQKVCLNTEAGDRRGFAERAKQTPYPGFMFSLLDGKGISGAIWQMLRPPAEDPYFGKAD